MRMVRLIPYSLNVPLLQRAFIPALLNGVANVLFHILQPVRQGFHVLTNLLGGYLCVDLGRLYVGMSQKSADGFNRYSVG